MLVVDDDSLLTGGLVGAQMVMDTPVTPPLAAYTSTTPGQRKRGTSTTHTSPTNV